MYQQSRHSGARLVFRLIAMRPVNMHECALYLVKGLHLTHSTLILSCAHKGSELVSTTTHWTGTEASSRSVPCAEA